MKSGQLLTWTVASIFHSPNTGCEDKPIFKLAIPESTRHLRKHQYCRSRLYHIVHECKWLTKHKWTVHWREKEKRTQKLKSDAYFEPQEIGSIQKITDNKWKRETWNLPSLKSTSSHCIIRTELGSCLKKKSLDFAVLEIIHNPPMEGSHPVGNSIHWGHFSTTTPPPP